MKRANGQGTCVFDPRIERWRVRLSKKAGGGKRTWLKENGHAMTFATQEDAERMLAAISVVDGGGADDIIGSCREAFEAELRRRDLEQDRRDQKNDWSTFRVWIAKAAWIDWPPTAVGTRHGIDWVEAMLQTRVHGRGVRRAGRAANGAPQLVARATVKGALSLATTLFGTLVNKGTLAVNPFTGIRVPGKDVKESKHFTWRETVAILRCEKIPAIERALLAVFFGSGARHDEIFLTPKRNIAIGPEDDGAWFVEYGSNARGKMWGPKNERQRTVTLFGIALWGAREYARHVDALGWENPNALAFPSRREGRPRYRLREWYTWLEWAGVRTDLDSYKMKHTCASLLLRGEMHHVIREVLGIVVPRRRWTLDELAALMGHSSIEVTSRYAHFCEKESDRAARETMGVKDDEPPPPRRPEPSATSLIWPSDFSDRCALAYSRVVVANDLELGPAPMPSTEVEKGDASRRVDVDGGAATGSRAGHAGSTPATSTGPSHARRAAGPALSTAWPRTTVGRKGSMTNGQENEGISSRGSDLNRRPPLYEAGAGSTIPSIYANRVDNAATNDALFLLSLGVLFSASVDSATRVERARELLAAVAPLVAAGTVPGNLQRAIERARAIAGEASR